MVEKNSPRYIEVSPKIVHSYNRTWHSGIHSEPINVNKTNEKQLWSANVLAKRTVRSK